MGVVQKPNDWAGIKAIDQSGFGTGVLALGALVILTGVTGILTAKCKKFYFTCPFVTCTLVFGLVILIVGVIIVGVAGDLIDVIQKEVCKATSASNENIA